MRILVACEESQTVTKELRALGHAAYSCDILPCSGGHPEWHLLGDATEALPENWDMIIAFPPCTHLASAGARSFAAKRADGRQQKAIDFFMQFTNLNCAKIAIENPVGIMSTQYRKPDQIVHPYYFGDSYTKKTCLWLKGLPQLVPTNIVDGGRILPQPNGKSMPEWYNAKGISKENRAKYRSKTFPGIAKAMARQWTEL